MTDDTMAFLSLIQKSDDGDFLQTVAEAAFTRLKDRLASEPSGRRGSAEARAILTFRVLRFLDGGEVWANRTIKKREHRIHADER